MVSNASPGTADPKMNESFVHTAHMSSDHARAQGGYFKRPHPTIIDGDMGSDSDWFLGGFGVVGLLTRDYLAAAVVPRPPWCPLPGTTAYNNQPTCYVTSRCR